MEYYVGLDLGTTNFKCAVMDAHGGLAAAHSVPAPMQSSGKARTMRPGVYVDTVLTLIEQTRAQAGVNRESLRAVACATAAGNTLILDGGMSPAQDVVCWTDERALGRDGLFESFPLESVHEVTGWPYVGMFSLAHLALAKEQGLLKSCGKVCMSTEYLLYRLCGQWGLDPSSAVPFGLVDTRVCRYHAPYLKYFGLREEQLPPIRPTGTLLGNVRGGDAPLPPGCAVVLGSFDHPACALGMGMFEEGSLLVSCGTSWTGLFLTRDREACVRQGLLVHDYPGAQGMYAAIFSLARFGEIIDRRVEQYVSAGADRFTLLGGRAARSKCEVTADLTDGNACARLFADMNEDDRARCIMQSACAALARGLAPLQAMARIHRVYMAGGPSSSPVWAGLMARTLGRDIIVRQGRYTGALGAAMTAAVGAGGAADARDFFRQPPQDEKIYHCGEEPC